MELAVVEAYLKSLQERVCQGLIRFEPAGTAFHEDTWDYAEGGGGRSRVLTGAVFEKAGVNFSSIQGNELPAAALAGRPQLAGSTFQAMGVSIVVHPNNPYVPTSHFNVRVFKAVSKDDQRSTWWFGGGFDLTPYYIFEEDATHWHQVAFNACAPFGDDVYDQYKKQCDDYFYLKHRKECRGIGGLFYDDQNEWSFERCFDFMQAMGSAYLEAYLPIVDRRHALPFGEREKAFQKYRRGRYVEFNLLYDRGTLFGLNSLGRTESILMSMPPEVSWVYDWHPEPGTPEEKLYEAIKPRDWLTV